MIMTKLSLLIGAVLVAGGVALVREHRAMARLRADNLALQAQAGQVAELEAERQRLTNALARTVDQSLPEAQLRDLLKLRGEVGALRRQTNELAQLRTENDQLRSGASALPARSPAQTAPASLPRESWTFAGYADPDSALQSCLSAWSRGDPKAVVASFTPAHRASWGFKTDEEIAARLARNLRALKGFNILDRQSVMDDEVRLTVADLEGKQKVGFCFKRIGWEWKFDHEFRVNTAATSGSATSHTN
jgi:hypothetical protein